MGPSDLTAAAVWAVARPGSDSEVVAIQPASASFEDYCALLAETPIDAVYLGVRAPFLLRYAVAALEAGLHVLCEEPPAISAAEHGTLVAAARARRRVPIVAWRGAFTPVHRAAVELARSRLLGDLRVFSAVACASSGSADVLVAACLAQARRVFREDPREVLGTARCSVTSFVNVGLRFSGERLALFACGTDRRASLRYEVVGSHGQLRVDCGAAERGHDDLYATIAGVTTQRRFARESAFAAEIAQFSAGVLRQRAVVPTLREALANARVLEAIAEASRQGRSVLMAAREVAKPRRAWLPPAVSASEATSL
ncbi:MAG TPA: Gfo/Idh/MocA family oxidoreductase [Myxococcota bacterium]